MSVEEILQVPVKDDTSLSQHVEWLLHDVGNIKKKVEDYPDKLTCSESHLISALWHLMAAKKSLDNHGI
jgi:hypothetical protein